MIKTNATAIVAGMLLALNANCAVAASLVSAKKLEINVDEAKVEAERQALWGKIGGWCAIAEWHPAIAKCEESKDGETEYRTLTLKDGGVIKEKLLERGSATYKYQIVESPLPVKNYSAQFSITPDDDDLDEINVLWSATYDANGKDDKEARGVIDGIFKAGMDSIKAKHGMAAPAAAKADDDDKK
jgi:Polyketide cyclase / dehydrase and lipid transport